VGGEVGGLAFRLWPPRGGTGVEEEEIEEENPGPGGGKEGPEENEGPGAGVEGKVV
jgi:hypothetical protein